MRFIVKRHVRYCKVKYFDTVEELRRYILSQRKLKDLHLVVRDIRYNADVYEIAISNLSSYRERIGAHDLQGEYDIDGRTGCYSPRNYDSGSTMKFGWWS